jgi:hypothetical protein
MQTGMAPKPFAAGPPMGRVMAGILVASAAILAVLSACGLSGLMLLHAGAMIIAWGVLVPCGVLIARYFKVTRQQDFPRQLDNQFWWNWHRLLQYAGAALSTAGFFAMVGMAGVSLTTGHAQLGLAVVLIGWVQVLSGLLRGSKGGPTEAQMRGDHYDMTLRRRIFEHVHKGLGWAVLPLAVAAMLTGLALVGLPDIVSLAVVALIAAFLAMAWRFQRQGRRVATYLAIWGTPEPRK